MKKDLGNKLRKLRENTGLTQKELAKELNISCASIHAYENNKTKPLIKMLMKLAEYYQIPLIELRRELK